MMMTDQGIGLEQSGRPQVVLLPRDPNVAYVYWESPTPGATLRLEVNGENGQIETVETFDVGETLGGRFVSFARPGALHRCQLEGEGFRVQTSWSQAPRTQPGSEPAGFVHIEWDGDDFALHATAHHDPVLGPFPPAHRGALGGSERPSSTTHTSSGARR
jgi:hypothetical protein